MANPVVDLGSEYPTSGLRKAWRDFWAWFARVSWARAWLWFARTLRLLYWGGCSWFAVDTLQDFNVMWRFEMSAPQQAAFAGYTLVHLMVIYMVTRAADRIFDPKI